MQTGCLYKTKKYLMLTLEENRAVELERQMSNNFKSPQVIPYGIQPIKHIDSLALMSFKDDYCFVPKGAVVMYIETGKTGSYKLVYGETIGWTSDTVNLLEEMNLNEHAEG